jgi:hypothetical protein
MTLYDQFIEDVKLNVDKHNKFVKLCVERHLNDLKDGKWLFDRERADKAIMIIKMLRHTSGSYGGKNFDIQPFQAFVVAMLFGWLHPVTGYRRYKKAYIEMARKGGKWPTRGIKQDMCTMQPERCASCLRRIAASLPAGAGYFSIRFKRTTQTDTSQG